MIDLPTGVTTGMDRARLRVLYVDGPGNVAGTYRLWKAGQIEPAEVNKAFSAEFFDVARRLPMDALVVATHLEPAHIKDAHIEVLHHPYIFRGKGGLWYYLSQAQFSLWLMWQALRFRADLVVAAQMGLPFMLAPLAWCGVRIAPIMHNTLWPKGYEPNTRGWRIQKRLLAWFWKTIAAMGIAVSPECARQVATITAGQNCSILQSRAQYFRDYLDAIPAAQFGRRPFRVLFAGRMEWDKGIADVLEAARQMHASHPNAFVWDVCGTGSALEAAGHKVRELGLADVFVFHGQADRQAMLQHYANCSAVVVPTGRGFAEGLGRVAVEAVLAKRPLVLTTVCPASDVLVDCAIEIPPNDPAAMAVALLKLQTDAALYQRLMDGAQAAQGQFYDSSKGLGAAIETLCLRLFGNPEKEARVDGAAKAAATVTAESVNP